MHTWSDEGRCIGQGSIGLVLRGFYLMFEFWMPYLENVVGYRLGNGTKITRILTATFVVMTSRSSVIFA
jgi:hypothetical protein